MQALRIATTTCQQPAVQRAGSSPPAPAAAATVASLRPRPAHVRPVLARTSHHHHHTATSSRTNEELAADINAACNAALVAMLANDASKVPDLERRLQALRLRVLEEAQDLEADRLLRVVEGMLQHVVLKEADDLSGRYATALNRLVNQVAGSDWKLALEGRSPDAAPDEPKFSTWEDVLNKKKQQQQQKGQQGSGSGASGSSTGASSSSSNNGAGMRASQGGVADRSYYDLLGVAPTADQPAIKSAYRQLALKLHPDVNAAPDAEQRFAEVASAYDVLSDPGSRVLYDRYGPDGMRGQPGAGAGSGNAGRAWDEFKPFKKQNKRTKARDASTASYGSSVDEPEAADGSSGSSGSSSSSSGGGSIGSEPSGATAVADPAAAPQEGGTGDSWRQRWAAFPVAGTVVEYPLPQQVKLELQDGRSHGVGLLVGRNCDRGDARKLPEEALDLCEIEPLRQEEAESIRWIPDELSASAFVRLGELRPLPVDAFDQRFDVWIITAQLSEGCGGPDLGEEVIL